MTATDPDVLLYFAYGSNMNSRRLTVRVPSAVAKVVGYIEKRRLTFDKVSRKDGSGKCDCEETEDVRDRLYGVVYQIKKSDKPRLDMAEGLDRGYKEMLVQVTTLRGHLQATTYVATIKDSSLKPFHWYKQHVVHGASAHGLPDDYVAIILSVESVPDPDKKRVSEEMQYLLRIT